MKNWLKDFPTHQATVVVALMAISLVTIVTVVRLAIGLIFPDGYDTYLWMLAALCGVAGAWGVGKRATDYDYAAIKAGAAPPAVQAGAGSVVTVEKETEAPKGAP
jgi:hypothetical protein